MKGHSCWRFSTHNSTEPWLWEGPGKQPTIARIFFAMITMCKILIETNDPSQEWLQRFARCLGTFSFPPFEREWLQSYLESQVNYLVDVVSFYHQPREGEDDDTRLVIRQLCDNSWNALPAASESNLLKFCYWITHLATHSVKIPVTSRRAMHQRYFDLFNNHGLRRILQNAFSDACLLELQTREAMNALLQTSTTLHQTCVEPLIQNSRYCLLGKQMAWLYCWWFGNTKQPPGIYRTS